MQHTIQFNFFGVNSILFKYTFTKTNTFLSGQQKKNACPGFVFGAQLPKHMIYKTLNLKSKHSLEIKLFPGVLHPLYNSGTISKTTATNFVFTHI